MKIPPKLKFIQSDRYNKRCELPLQNQTVEKPVGWRRVFIMGFRNTSFLKMFGCFTNCLLQ